MSKLDIHSDEFHFIFIKFMIEKGFQTKFGFVEDNILSNQLSDVNHALDIIENPQNHEFILKKIENEDVLLVKHEGKFLRFDILLYMIYALGPSDASDEEEIKKNLGVIRTRAGSLFYCLINAKLLYTSLVPYEKEFALQRKLDLSEFVKSFCDNINISDDCKNYVKNLHSVWLKKYQFATESIGFLEKKSNKEQIEFLDNLMNIEELPPNLFSSI